VPLRSLARGRRGERRRERGAVRTGRRTEGSAGGSDASGARPGDAAGGQGVVENEGQGTGDGRPNFLGLTHPGLYAAVVSLVGPPQCGVSLDAGQLVRPAFGGAASPAGLPARRPRRMRGARA
jgi:hypothetical protein